MNIWRNSWGVQIHNRHIEIIVRQITSKVLVSEELLCLAQGPMKGVTSYEGYVINGFRFHTRRRQRNRKTQNSGVVVEGGTENGKKDILKKVDHTLLGQTATWDDIRGILDDTQI